jgi:hypothetical protein
MASGHAGRIDRPNTWLLRPGCDVKKVLANTEPSTHGTTLKSSAVQRFRQVSEVLSSWRRGLGVNARRGTSNS